MEVKVCVLNVVLVDKIMKAEDIINWGELSRMLSGSRQTVRKNKIPKIHQEFIYKLLAAMEKVINKRNNKL